MAQFKAAMFDFDGTVTEKGKHIPAAYVVEAILALGQKHPVAFCTGRQLESFVEHGMRQFFKALDEPKYDEEQRDNFLRNLFLIAENGSIGYFFDVKAGEFKEFYRVKWPDHFISKEALKAQLKPLVAEWGEPMDVHRTVVVVRTIHSTALKIQQVAIEEVYKLSDKIYDATEGLLKGMREDYQDYLHIGNSGIGVLVCSAEGDKDNGIRAFADYLRNERGFEIGDEAREIVVIGDRPGPSGNDFHFLKGKYGTPFTVGDYNADLPFPKPVFNDEDERLLHAPGTAYLVKKLFLAEN